jgi:hypothetical protein
MGLLGLGAVVILASGKGEERESKYVNVSSPSAIEMMSVAFVGSHSKSQIEAEVRRAANAFNLPATDDNFSRMGSALVAVRQQSRVSEMNLLRCANAMGEEVAGTNVGLDFPTAVGMCAGTLAR